jgi:hypothetical protein
MHDLPDGPSGPRSYLAQLATALQRIKYERDAGFQREDELAVELAAYDAMLGAVFAWVDAGEQD